MRHPFEDSARLLRVGSSCSLSSNAAVGRATHGTVGCNVLDESSMASSKVQLTSEPGHDERPVSATADIHPPNSNDGSQSIADVAHRHRRSWADCRSTVCCSWRRTHAPDPLLTSTHQIGTSGQPPPVLGVPGRVYRVHTQLNAGDWRGGRSRAQHLSDERHDATPPVRASAWPCPSRAHFRKSYSDPTGRSPNFDRLSRLRIHPLLV